MSFAEFGGKSSKPVSAPSSTNSVGYATSSGSKSGLEVISETLLQYQRNVGILEKIVQSLNSRNNNDGGSLTIQQYDAQNHVLEQLEEKIRSLLRQQPKQNTAVIKLKRDFERVKLRASQLQESAVERISSIQSSKVDASSGAPLSNPFNNYQPNVSDGSDTSILKEQQRLQQLQLEEDRLHEEIMREREEEIRNINRGMHTVNEIYKDLAHIVGQQQEQIDIIENQMEDSRVNAESGLKQVEKANEKYGQQCSIQ